VIQAELALARFIQHPLDANIVKGTHGRLPTPGKEASESPVFISSSRQIERDHIPMTAVKEMILNLQFASEARTGF
jgi:hypothetical protein